MTIGDLFAGEWTWWQLANDVLPIIISAFMAFWAGYERGRLVGLKFMSAQLSRLERGEAQGSAK